MIHLSFGLYALQIICSSSAAEPSASPSSPYGSDEPIGLCLTTPSGSPYSHIRLANADTLLLLPPFISSMLPIFKEL